MRAALSPAHVPQNALEAQCLASQLSMYYAGTAEDFQHVQHFNKAPAQFKHTALITRLQSLPPSS